MATIIHQEHFQTGDLLKTAVFDINLERAIFVSCAATIGPLIETQVVSSHAEAVTREFYNQLIEVYNHGKGTTNGFKFRQLSFV